MNCHSQIWSNAPILEPVRASFRDDRPLRWVRVHDLPDFVYFNHSIHVKKGMGCETCHGRVDQMPLMQQVQSLQMEWCLDCHRNPAEVRAATQRGVHDGLPPCRSAVGAGPDAREGVRDQGQHQLLHVPPVTRT